MGSELQLAAQMLALGGPGKCGGLPEGTWEYRNGPALNGKMPTPIFISVEPQLLDVIRLRMGIFSKIQGHFC